MQKQFACSMLKKKESLIKKSESVDPIATEVASTIEKLKNLVGKSFDKPDDVYDALRSDIDNECWWVTDHGTWGDKYNPVYLNRWGIGGKVSLKTSLDNGKIHIDSVDGVVLRQPVKA